MSAMARHAPEQAAALARAAPHKNIVLMDDETAQLPRVQQGFQVVRAQAAGRSGDSGSPATATQLQAAFDSVDESGDGTLDVDELKGLLDSLGHQLTKAELEAKVQDLDEDVK